MSKQYQTHFFQISSRLQTDFQKGRLTEKQFYSLLGLALTKQFSGLLKQNMKSILPQNNRSIANFISYR